MSSEPTRQWALKKKHEEQNRKTEEEWEEEPRQGTAMNWGRDLRSTKTCKAERLDRGGRQSLSLRKV